MQVGELMIKMGADVAQLRTDMASARRTVTSTMSDIQASVDMAKQGFIALTGVASAAGFVLLVRNMIEAKARMYDLSLQTGATVERFSALAEVGRYANTSVEQIASAMNKLSRSLTGADEDSKGAAVAIRALGLNFGQFVALAPDEKMQAVARSIQQLASDEQKAQAAMLLFGKAGAEMLPFLKELAETTTLVAKETTENARRAKELEDNLLRLRAAGEDFRRGLLNEVLPTLLRFTEELIDGKKAYDGWLGAILNAPFAKRPWEDMAQALARNRSELEGLGAELADLQRQQANPSFFGPAARVLESDIERIRGKIAAAQRDSAYLKAQQARGALALGEGVADDPRIAARKRFVDLTVPDKAREKITDIERLIGKLREQIATEELEAAVGRKLTEGEKDAARVMADLRDGRLQGTAAERGLVAALLERRLATERLNDEDEKARKEADADARQRETLLESAYKQAEALRAQAEAQEATNKTIGKSTDELQRLEVARLLDAAAALHQRAEAVQSVAGYEMLADLWKRQAEQLDALANAKARAAQIDANLRADPFEGARRGLQDYLRDIRDVNRSAYDLVRNTSQLMEDSLTDFFTTGRGGARRFVDGLLAEFTRLLVVRPLLNSLLGGGFGGGLTGFIGSLLGSAGTGAAGAGAVSGPGISAPAGFTLGAAAPASAGAAGGTQIALHMTNNFATGVPRNEITAAMAQATQAAVATIADSQRRGGVFA